MSLKVADPTATTSENIRFHGHVLRTSLEPGPHWTSAEHLRAGIAAQLQSLKPGMVATITSKKQNYRLLRSEDFDALTERVRLAHEAQEAMEDVRLALAAYATAPTEEGRALIGRLAARLQTLRSTLFPEEDRR